MSIYSLQIEKYTISGLIKHPEAFADIESFINEKSKQELQTLEQVMRALSLIP